MDRANQTARVSKASGTVAALWGFQGKGHSGLKSSHLPTRHLWVGYGKGAGIMELMEDHGS